MKALYCIALCLVLQGAGNLAGQEVLHKASISDERIFGKGIASVAVYGEKASVTVRGWSNNEVKVILRPVSRNRNREKAVADLKYIYSYVEKEGDRLVVRNSFRGKMEQITSNLTMEIEILMPLSLPADITNLYGPVEISNLESVTASVSFGSLTVTDISKACRITTRYSDMVLASVRGKLDITAEKSDIRAVALSAATTISSSYGEAELDLAGAGPFTLKGYRTAVAINVDGFDKYRYSLRAKEGMIILPGGRPAGDRPVEILHDHASGYVDVTTSYCDITVTTK